MNIEFLSSFEKDLSQTRDKRLAKVILDSIHLFEEGTVIFAAFAPRDKIYRKFP